MSEASGITQVEGLRRIHVVFKTHLDVGFTDFAANVVANYFNRYIPKAIELAEVMRKSGDRKSDDRKSDDTQSGSGDNFVWTTGSWLIYQYLEQADAAARARMEWAIANGDIAWHALPFTTHSENMSPELFRFGLSLSHDLDRRFGKHTIAAKMTDVPGHTRGIVPLLAEAGVQFLHIGVNAASTPPDVPPVFVWRDPPSGKEIMVMYHKGSYGDLMVVPGLADAIAFAHTGDNLGPQSPEALQAGYRALREKFPGVAVAASTMDAFAEQLASVRASLPVIEQEFGDTWIHGAGTDPLKEARYRQLLRLRQELLASGTPAAQLHKFSLSLLSIPEHTWGLDVKTHLKDWSNYRAADFQAARNGPNYQKMEASWQEQRAYIDQAVAALPGELRLLAEQRLASLAAKRPDTSGYLQIDHQPDCFRVDPFTLAFDPVTGALTRLEKNGIPIAGPGEPLCHFWYQTFSAADYQRFYRQYNVNKRVTREWAIPDFTKPGLEQADPASQVFQSQLAWFGQKDNTFLLKLELPRLAHQDYGAPREIWLEVAVHQDQVAFTLQWFDKPACRMPEATWFSFAPRMRNPHDWRMDKLGEWISPYEVIRDGNRHLHAVGQGVRGQGISIDTLDCALVAPGQPSLLDFNNRQPDLRLGWHFNLHNNLWGTNFPMWYGEDAKFRFILRADS